MDNGKAFPLKSYRRLVLRTGETGFNVPCKYVNDIAYRVNCLLKYRS